MNTLVWGLLWVCWGVGVCHSVVGRSRYSGVPVGADDGRALAAAQVEYLRGEWYEAEAILRRILIRHPRDIEARLLLATMFRHVRRIRDAREQLTTLERLDGSARWHWELRRERELLVALQNDSTDKASNEEEVDLDPTKVRERRPGEATGLEDSSSQASSGSVSATGSTRDARTTKANSASLPRDAVPHEKTKAAESGLHELNVKTSTERRAA